MFYGLIFRRTCSVAYLRLHVLEISLEAIHVSLNFFLLDVFSYAVHLHTIETSTLRFYSRSITARVTRVTLRDHAIVAVQSRPLECRAVRWSHSKVRSLQVTACDDVSADLEVVMGCPQLQEVRLFT